MREREQIKVVVQDPRQLLDQISPDMPFDQATTVLSDLSNAVVSFDQGNKQFRVLIKSINQSLKNKGGFNLYDLVQASHSLNISTFDSAILAKVSNRDYSRSAKDISILIHSYSMKAMLQQPDSVGRNKYHELLVSLINEFKFMKVTDLTAEHIQYLSQGIQQISKLNSQGMDLEMEKVQEFIPKFIDQAQNELYRFALADLVLLVQSLQELYETDLIQAEDLAKTHKVANVFLSDFLFKSKPNISTRNIGMLLDMMAFAKEKEVFEYDTKLIHKLKQIFSDDMADNNTFSATDLRKVFTSMETLEPTWGKEAFHKAVTKATLDCLQNNDADLLIVFKLLDQLGILDADEENILVQFLQNYFEDKFELMDKNKDIFDYLEFMKHLGTWYWNTTLLEQLKTTFAKNFFEYDLNQLGRLTKIIAYNFEKDDQILTLVEDSMKIRVSHAIQNEEQVDIDLEGMLALTEGMAVLQIRRTRLVSLLKRILLDQHGPNKHAHLMCQSSRLTVQVVSLLSDLDVNLGPKLSQIIESAVTGVHIPEKSFSIGDLSYLALCSNVLSPEALESIKEASFMQLVKANSSDLERLALAFGGKDSSFNLDQTSVEAKMKETEANSNLVEVLSGMLSGAGLTIHQRTLVDSRIRANFIVENPKASGKRHLVEIIEDDISHYKQLVSGKESELVMRQRGRLANELAQSLGYTGYSCISYIELEKAVDEAEPFNQVISRSFEMIN